MTMSRRTLLAGALAAPVLVKFALVPAAAQTATAPGVSQVVAVQRLKVGEAIVTAISDGFIPIDTAFLSNVTPEAANEMLAAAFVAAASPVVTGVNAYVVQLADQTVLIDAGGAGMAPSLGKLMPGLEAAGIAPEDITAVLLTHLHADHIGAMIVDGQPAFPNAAVHVHEIEAAFWTSAENRAAAPDQFKPFFDSAKAVVDGYGDRVKTFTGAAEVVPGITARELFGHTPGHCGYLVGSGEDSLLVWGDIVHVGPVQFAKPDVGIAFDTDGARAVATRQALLAEVAEQRTRVAGMHISFPGVGHVVKAVEDGAYAFQPAPWTYAL
ncbi:MBL fold metallo-hydrolase [Aurantimonas sp. HBX-1]|uniref:MBL fold metallo-hydrolase n=1 Tax=Aurantimonas sp. HBX-1 TaxID=2906072 RepID=UPI001F396869|nr:MBL fold metallo-hydrolase [Aurantimonas sp. HBX-1]UIJ73231.1 MBL fold metallo-hydrolase [Aurantimonas sp. HBX-1]